MPILLGDLLPAHMHTPVPEAKGGLVAGDTRHPGLLERDRRAEQGQWAGGRQNHSPGALRVTATGVVYDHLSLGSKALSSEFGD